MITGERLDLDVGLIRFNGSLEILQNPFTDFPAIGRRECRTLRVDARIGEQITDQRLHPLHAPGDEAEILRCVSRQRPATVALKQLSKSF